MEETLKDVVEASSPSDVQAAPSPAQEAPAETPAQQVEPKEVPFHEHPRWKKVQQEKERAREEAERAKSEAAYYKGLAEGSKQPAPDLTANMTPEEKAFWEKAREISRQEAKQEVEAIRKQYDPYIERYEKESVMTVYETFKEKHPDITQDDEVSMARIVKPLRQSGMTPKEALETAYKSVFFEKNVQKTAQQTRQQQTEKLQQKAAANLETTTVSQGSIPTKEEKLDLRETLKRGGKQMGIPGF